MTATARDPSPQRFWWLLGLILAVGLGLRAYALSGWLGADSLAYAQHAASLSRWELDLSGTDQYVHRLPVYAPTALGLRLGLPAAAAVSAGPMLASLLQLLLSVLLAQRLFGSGIALATGAIMALLSFEVLNGIRLMPDVFQAMFTTAALVSALAATDSSGRRGSALYGLSGVCIAMAIVIRLYALLAVLPIAFWILGEEGAWRRAILPLALGIVLPLVALGALYGSVTGDALHPWRSVLDNYGQQMDAETRSMAFYLRDLVRPRGSLGLLGPVACVALPALAIVRGRSRLLLLIWIAIFLSYLSAGSMGLEEYRPVFKRARFLTPILPAIVIAVVASGVHLVGAVGRKLGAGVGRGLSAVGAVLLLLLALQSLQTLRNDRAGRQAEWNSAVTAAAWLADGAQSEHLVFDHWRTALRFQYLLGFRFRPPVYLGSHDAARMARERSTRWNYAYLSWYSELDELRGRTVVLDRLLLEAWRAPGRHESYLDDPYPALAQTFSREDPRARDYGPYRLVDCWEPPPPRR